MEAVRLTHIWAVPVAVFSIVSLAAQQPCASSPEIEQAVAQFGSAKQYTAKGKYLALHGNFDCAKRAFQKAIELDTGDWQSRFNLALIHIKQHGLEHALPHLARTAELRPQFLEARLALGSVLAKLGNMSGAAEEFTAALDIDPSSAEALYHLAKTNMAQRRYRAAIGQLRRALKIRPDDLEFNLLLGLAYSNTGKTDDAIALLDPLVEAEPDYFETRFNLAAAYAQAGRYSEAAEQYKQAMRLDPENDSARLFAAKALIKSNRHQEALEVFTNTSELLDNEFDLYFVRGLAFRGVGNFEQAAADLHRATEIRPTDAEAQSHLGFVLSRQGKLEQARKHLELAKNLNPKLRDTRFELLSVLKQLGDLEAASAESALFEARKHREKMQLIVESSLRRARTYLEQGDPKLALQEYRQAMRHDPDNAETYYGISLALAQLGADPGERTQILEKVVALDPGLAEAHNDLGVLYAEIGRVADAEHLLYSALKINPEHVEANTNLGVLHARRGHNIRAEPLFRRAIEDNPNYAPAYVNYGLTLAALERFGEAAKTLQKAEELQPNNLKTLTGLGMVYMRQKKFEKALSKFRKTVALAPKNIRANLNIGIVLSAMFDLKGALTAFTKATELNPNSSQTRYYRGQCLFDLSRYEEAEMELRAAADLAPQSSTPLYLLALAEKQRGNVQGAVDLLQNLVKKDPVNSAAHFQLGQITAKLHGETSAVIHWRDVVKIDPSHAEALYCLARVSNWWSLTNASQFETRQQRYHIKKQVRILDHFALASAAAHDWDGAVTQLTEAIAECGECMKQPQLHKHLGLVYARSGQPTAAERELRISNRLAPEDVEVKQALHWLKKIRKNSSAESP